MKEPSIKIEIGPYEKSLIKIWDGLSAGINALAEFHSTNEDDDVFDADDILETRDMLTGMRNYVSDELKCIIETGICIAEKNNQ